MGFLDNIFGGGEDERRRAGDAMRSVQVPTLDDLRIQLEELVLQGELRPEEAQTMLQDPSAYETIQTDPRLRGSQMESLAELQGIVGAGGMDARGKATLEDALGRQRTESRGDQQAILANTRARGIGGSDIETMSRMLASSDAATRGSRAAVDSAALAQQRRDNAIAQSATLSGNIRGQDWNEAAQRASAADAIGRFNAAQRQGVENLNVGNRNAAQATNLGARQEIADQNVATRNKQTTYNAQLPMTMYDLQRGKAVDEANYQLGQAGAEQQRNKNIANTVVSVGSLMAGGFGGLAGASALMGKGSGGSEGGMANATGGSDVLADLERRLRERGL